MKIFEISKHCYLAFKKEAILVQSSKRNSLKFKKSLQGTKIPLIRLLLQVKTRKDE